MKSKFQPSIWIAAVALVSLATFGGWRYFRPSDRVTLDVRNMDVREVTRLIERQTGRTIVLQSNVVGRVTLKAKELPFDQTLAIVGEQTFARVSSIYPLYSNNKSLATLKSILSGAIESRAGWINLETGGIGFGRPNPRRDETQKEARISLNIAFEDLNFTALAFSRFTPARIVVEDGATKRITVNLTNASVNEAIALVAKKAGTKWTQIYTLSGGGPGPRGFGNGPGIATERTEEESAQREVLNDQLLATLPPEERQKREEVAAERAKRMEELQGMTADQRAQAMQTMRQNQPQGAGSQRMLERLKNSTPEQRAAQRRQMGQRASRPTGSGFTRN